MHEHIVRVSKRVKMQKKKKKKKKKNRAPVNCIVTQDIPGKRDGLVSDRLTDSGREAWGLETFLCRAVLLSELFKPK